MSSLFSGRPCRELSVYHTYTGSADMTRIPLLDLFSGIGGFSFALREVTDTVAYCEIDTRCRDVILKNIKVGRLDDAPIFSDVTQMSSRDLPKKPLIITAGFPCQDIALSNPKGLGLEGLRSKMVFEVFRLIDEIDEVRCILLENSPALRLKGLATIVEQFLIRRFACSWGVFSAADVGAPQIRKRMFIMATRNSFIPPHISLQKLRFSHTWKTETALRVLPRKTTEKGVEVWTSLIKRNRMLGNGVVPQTVIYAYSTLAKALDGSLPVIPRSSANKMLRQVTIFRATEKNDITETRILIEPSGKSMPDTDVVMRDGPVEYRKKFWNTPCASPLYYSYTHLTPRSQFLLANELFYEVKTREFIRSQGEVDFDALHKRWTINPNWIEWLMGYPQNYTKT